MITIEHLTKHYISGDKRVDALKDVNLHIEKGDIFGVIGLSGAGKSTLVRCINRLEEPSSGRILVAGQEVTNMGEEQLRQTRKKIGMIFQHFNLLMNSTVADNIAFPLKLAKLPKNKIEERVNQLLTIVGLVDKREAYPAMLSGGQKQRVGIARALANEPEILLCDEATSALDPLTTDAILELLKNINQQYGITIVIITHEMSVIKKICHKVAVMEGGTPAEVGDVVEVFSRPKSKTAKDFLEDDLFHLSKEVKREVSQHQKAEHILKISFRGDIAKEPIISDLIKQYDIDVSIMAGNIEQIQRTTLGYLVVKIIGQPDQLDKSITYLKSKHLGLEVL